LEYSRILNHLPFGMMAQKEIIVTDTGPTPAEVLHTDEKNALHTVRLLYSGYVLLAMAAVVLSWQLAPSILLPVALTIIALTLVIAIMSNIISRLNQRTAIVGQVVLFLFVTSTISLFISSAFFGIPERGAVIVARLLASNQLAVWRGKTASRTLDPGAVIWPTWVQEQPDGGSDRFAMIAALSKSPSLTVSGSRLPAKGHLYFNTLRLEDATILTDGNDVTIEAVRIESVGKATIRAFERGDAAAIGRSGGRLTFIVYDQFSGRLNVDLSGGSGETGTTGRAGQDGATGAPGENSAQGLFDCKHGGGVGQRGGPGAPGEDGGAGRGGGDGGTFIVQSMNPDQILRNIDLTLNGGPGGAGGPGGRGGNGGPGGQGGRGGGFCGGGQPGPPGPNGPNGRAGPDGPPGREGSIITLSFDKGSPK
jgi:hypothetical protein